MSDSATRLPLALFDNGPVPMVYRHFGHPTIGTIVVITGLPTPTVLNGQTGQTNASVLPMLYSARHDGKYAVWEFPDEIVKDTIMVVIENGEIVLQDEVTLDPITSIERSHWSCPPKWRNS